MGENEIDYLEQMIPTLASGALSQAYMESLAAGNSVLEVIDNVLYEVSPDGSKKKIKDAYTKQGDTKTREKPRMIMIGVDAIITTKELSERIDITLNGIEWQLQKLKKEGLLVRAGSAKGGRWVVL